MLCYEYWLAITTKIRKQFGGFSLQSSYEFGAHRVILKYHSHDCNET